MFERSRWWVVVILVIMLIVGVIVIVILNRGGYLPKPVTLTAEVAPSSVPLPSPIPTLVPSSTLAPTQVATPTTEPAQPVTPSAIPVPATRVVPPAEQVNLPAGFGISVFVSGLAQPRMMAVGPDNQLYVAERGARRIIRLPDRDQDGVADDIEVVADGLDAPSSLAFYHDGALYVGETTRVLRLSTPNDQGIMQQREVVVDGLPEGGHNTRTVLFSPDQATLFVSVGSSCNVCEERDARRATVMQYTPDGGDERIFAAGLRNAVGITFRPGTDELWATNNGRDWLGDDQPPETVYRLSEGADAGWPRCHSGRIVDPDFGYADACDGVIAPVVEMQAHSAPLGLAFYSGVQFPEPYRGALFVAFHGSWNRATPTGYKVVWLPVADNTPGAVADFATGWLREDGTNWGRPVDVVTGADGSLFVSDDGAGIIYRIFYVQP